MKELHRDKTTLVFMKVTMSELRKLFPTDTEYPDIIPEANEHVSRNHNVLDETDHSFLMHIWSRHQTVFSVLEKSIWMYPEEIMSIQKNSEGGYFFFF